MKDACMKNAGLTPKDESENMSSVSENTAALLKTLRYFHLNIVFVLMIMLAYRK